MQAPQEKVAEIHAGIWVRIDGKAYKPYWDRRYGGLGVVIETETQCVFEPLINQYEMSEVLVFKALKRMGYTPQYV